MAIARGAHTVSAYLHAQNAAKLIEFYEQAFGAEVGYRGERPDGSVEHAELTIGDSLLELADTPVEQPMMLHHYVPEADAVYARALAAGATSLQPPVNQSYGDREAGVRDSAGNIWWIATHQGANPIPEGLHSLTIYLNPNGADRLIEFVKQTFGAEELFRGQTASGAVYHSKIRIGNSVLEISDAHPPYPCMPGMVRVFLPEVDAVYERALQAGATPIAKPEDKPYGERNAGVKDAFGNTWYIAQLLA